MWTCAGLGAHHYHPLCVRWAWGTLPFSGHCEQGCQSPPVMPSAARMPAFLSVSADRRAGPRLPRHPSAVPVAKAAGPACPTVLCVSSACSTWHHRPFGRQPVWRVWWYLPRGLFALSGLCASPRRWALDVLSLNVRLGPRRCPRAFCLSLVDEQGPLWALGHAYVS